MFVDTLGKSTHFRTETGGMDLGRGEQMWSGCKINKVNLKNFGAIIIKKELEVNINMNSWLRWHI